LEAEEAGGSQEEGPKSYTPPEASGARSEPESEYMQDHALAYLAYILKETEMIRVRTEMIRRSMTVMIALLAVAVIVLIIVWLDITGAITIF
jgi:hypothetical protein